MKKEWQNETFMDDTTDLTLSHQKVSSDVMKKWWGGIIWWSSPDNVNGISTDRLRDGIGLR